MMVSPGRGFDLAAAVVGGSLLLLAGLVLQNAVALRTEVAYGIGPEAMPYLVGSAVLVLALAHIVVAFREGLPKAPTGGEPRTILWLSGGLAALLVCVGWGAGFIPAIAILFAATSRAFGRRALMVDLAIGFGLGVGIYLGFSKLLALGLPQGPLEKLL